MMRMLHHGGIPAYADNLVSFETSRVLGLPRDTAWLNDCRGRCVKLLEPLDFRPIPRAPWRFILMRRDVTEQARSAVKFMRALGHRELSAADVPRLARSLRADLPRVRTLLSRRGPILEVAFEDVLADPLATARRVEQFLGVALDTARMAEQVIARPPTCLPYLLETALVAQPVPGGVRVSDTSASEPRS